MSSDNIQTAIEITARRAVRNCMMKANQPFTKLHEAIIKQIVLDTLEELGKEQVASEEVEAGWHFVAEPFNIPLKLESIETAEKTIKALCPAYVSVEPILQALRAASPGSVVSLPSRGHLVLVKVPKEEPKEDV